MSCSFYSVFLSAILRLLFSSLNDKMIKPSSAKVCFMNWVSREESKNLKKSLSFRSLKSVVVIFPLPFFVESLFWDCCVIIHHLLRLHLFYTFCQENSFYFSYVVTFFGIGRSCICVIKFQMVGWLLKNHCKVSYHDFAFLQNMQIWKVVLYPNNGNSKHVLHVIWYYYEYGCIQIQKRIRNAH